MNRAFSHTDLEIKQHFLKLAREFRERATEDNKDTDQQRLANQLAGSLLYMNVADYIAEYLVTGLNTLAKESMNQYYLGVISINPPKKEGFNIGDSIYKLERYDFPKKLEVIAELREIKSARNKIAHQILKTNGKDLENIDAATQLLADHTEELVTLVDTISSGMPPRTVIEKLDEANS